MLEESVSLWASMYSWFTPTVLFVFLNLMIGTIAITSSFSSSKSTGDHSPAAHHQIQRSPSVLHRIRSISFSSPSVRSPDHFSDNSQSHLEFPLVSPNQQPLQQPPSIEQNHPFLSRSPSVLQRIKSFNLYNYISQEHNSSFLASDSPAPPQTQEIDQFAEADGTLETKAEEEAGGETSPTLDEVYSELNVSHMSRTMSDTEPAAGIIPPKLPQKMRKSASTKSPFAHFEEEDISVVEARRPATVREGRVAVADEDGETADEEVDAKADDFINRFKRQLKLQRIDSIMRYKEMVRKGSEK